MLKHQELARVDSCLSKSQPDEPVFVLCARDPFAAQTIRLWATMSSTRQQPERVMEALAVAEEFDKWRESRTPKMPSEPMPMAPPGWSEDPYKTRRG